MRAAYGRTLKFTLIGVGLFALSLGASLALTDREPATLPLRARRMAAVQAMAVVLCAAGRTQYDFLGTDTTFFGHRVRRQRLRNRHPLFEAHRRPCFPGRDPRLGRRPGRRGIAYLEAKLADLKSDDPATPATTANVQLLIGSLYMYEGEWAQASAHFSLAETADPARPALFRANMDALRGVAALRRGEVENCVACCNEASCVFPLGAAAVHRRAAGSREAIEHFTRYLQQRPEDLGVRWLLNVAYMTLGEYPEGVPHEFVLPLGRFAAPADDPRRMVNVAAKVGLNARGESMAGGCLVDDFDGDGLLDVFMPTTDPDRGALLCATAATAPSRTPRPRPAWPTRFSPLTPAMPTSITTAPSTS